MRTIVLALALASAPAMALACDSASDSNSATFILRDGDTTHMIGSIEDLKRTKAKLRGLGPALFVRLDGKEHVIDDAVTVDRARDIFKRSDPMDAKQEALERDMEALQRRQDALDEDDAAHAKLDAEERALDLRQEELDAAQDEASTQMELNLEKLVREAIRAGRVRS
jgi:multidrug efflux pump subunit AcrA (membrane-fusion protein)